eukprot:3696868-Pyramimonas_sp.AAC.1
MAIGKGGPTFDGSSHSCASRPSLCFRKLMARCWSFIPTSRSCRSHASYCTVVARMRQANLAEEK